MVKRFQESRTPALFPKSPRIPGVKSNGSDNPRKKGSKIWLHLLTLSSFAKDSGETGAHFTAENFRLKVKCPSLTLYSKKGKIINPFVFSEQTRRFT